MRIPMRGTVRRTMRYARRAAILSPQTLADTVAQTSKRRRRTTNKDKTMRKLPQKLNLRELLYLMYFFVVINMELLYPVLILIMSDFFHPGHKHALPMTFSVVYIKFIPTSYHLKN